MKYHIWKGLLPYTPVYREIIAIFLICYGFVGKIFEKVVLADIWRKEETSQKLQHILMANPWLESM